MFPQDPEHFTKAHEKGPESLPQRTLSAPLKHVDPPEIRRMRSPYAVQFPTSARLKPLDLGNPFYAQQYNPKRRASLPSVVLGDREAAAVAALIGQGESGHASRQNTGEIGIALTDQNSNSRRRSRSADDLRRAFTALQPPRERDEEIKYWRQSYTGSVLYTPMPGVDETEPDVSRNDSVTPQAQPSDPTDVRRSVSPLTFVKEGQSTTTTPMVSRPITAGGDSQELEERVTRLESRLLEFQESLQRLTADNNRETTNLDNRPPTRRSRQHTPSILVNTLRDPEYRAPQLEAVEEHGPSDGGASAEDMNYASSPRTPSPPAARTFATLYQIINDERSIRRTLETQVRGLQQNLEEMQYQLSQPIISRSNQPHTNNQTPRPQYVQPQHARNQSNVSSSDPGHRVISRFSQSDSLTDSEAARMQEQREEGEEEMQTPYETYQTPVEEFARHHYTSSIGSDAMF